MKLGPHDERVAELLGAREQLVHRVADDGCRDIRPGIEDQLLEDLAVLALVDRLEVRADELDVVLLEDAVVVQVDRGVERRLAAEGREDRVGALLRDDRLDDLPRDGLDVGRIGEVGVGHDRRGVRVDQDDAHALLAQHAARLRSRVVELARLADDDRPGADDEDALDVVALRHQFLSPCPEISASCPESARSEVSIPAELGTRSVWFAITMSRKRSKR